MKDWVLATSIAALTALESVAMFTGHDGAYLLPIACLIAGIAGYKVRQKLPTETPTAR